MIRSKRGVGDVIAWVLLIGLSISLATIVTIWMKQTTTKTAEFIINDVEGDVRCADVSMKAFVVQPSPACTDINISNTGYLKIIKVTARHQFGTQEFQVDLLPQTDSKVLNMHIPTKVEIIPVIEVGKGLLGCADRKLTLVC